MPGVKTSALYSSLFFFSFIFFADVYLFYVPDFFFVSAAMSLASKHFFLRSADARTLGR